VHAIPALEISAITILVYKTLSDKLSQFIAGVAANVGVIIVKATEQQKIKKNKKNKNMKQ